MRPFTVPSGMLSICAISECVNPPKYARPITSDCSSGSSCIAPRTWRAVSRRIASESVSSPAGCASRVASSSKSSFGALPAWRRSASIERLRTTPRVHERTLPRAASNRAPLRQIDRNASCVTSSAACGIADDPVGERIRRSAVTVVEDLERGRVLALDEGHEVLVGELLHRVAIHPIKFDYEMRVSLDHVRGADDSPASARMKDW